MSTANQRQVGGDHYKLGGEEHWDRIWRLYGRGYFIGCITKYVERYQYKDGLKDLEKAAHFLQKLIELEGGKVKPGEHYREVKWPLPGVRQRQESGAEPGPGYINQDKVVGCKNYTSHPYDPYQCGNCGLGPDFHK